MGCSLDPTRTIMFHVFTDIKNGGVWIQMEVRP